MKKRTNKILWITIIVAVVVTVATLTIGMQTAFRNGKMEIVPKRSVERTPTQMPMDTVGEEIPDTAVYEVSSEK